MHTHGRLFRQFFEIRDTLHEMSKVVILGKNKKYIINLSSAELANTCNRAVNVHVNAARGRFSGTELQV